MGRFQKRGGLGPGSERKTRRLQAPPDPDGEGLVNPSQRIWLNPTESVESQCVFLIFLNHTFELRNRKGEEKPPPVEHLLCVQVRTDALRGVPPLIPTTHPHNTL